MINEEAMVGRASKQAIIGTILSGVLVALMGCTSLTPKAEPTPVAAKPQPKVVRTTPPRKVFQQKKVVTKKVVKPVEDETVPPPVIPTMGGGGSSGGGWGG
ncbi:MULTISPECIES: hypothetical protein [unclassified Mesorhizobium]|uniref:hypothetical protein n=1 Tax=unclassified Mesorhizobium TaxID=325217 RepID=UPI001FDF7087|nr:MULTISPECIES: hypothetical protein [unclassified Mesorhizobium]